MNVLIPFINKNFTILYPKSWTLDTSRDMGTELYIISPPENDSDQFRENASLIIQNLGANKIDLEKYKKITEEQLVAMATDLKVFESAVFKSSKSDYLKITYAMTQGKFRLKITSICYIRNDKAYLFTFASEFDKYDRYQKTAEEILNSFSLTE